MEGKKMPRSVLVIMGGTSSEREISLKSGEAMYKALCNKGYNAEKFILNADNCGEIIAKKPDLAVLALHGKCGEDGTIQGLLELAGIPYTGSKVASSAMCMDKIITKKMFEQSHIPTAKYICVFRGETPDFPGLAKKAVSELGLPLVVKAPCQGSSVGVKIVKTSGELPKVLKEIYQYDNELLLEEFLPGTELTVPLMEDENGVKALPVIEIVSENEFYDFESKYAPGMSHHIIPARIPDDIMSETSALAVQAYKALLCNGVARVDFILGADGKPRAVEINTIPGMTATSLVPDAAAYLGISFDDLVDMIVKTSGEK